MAPLTLLTVTSLSFFVITSSLPLQHLALLSLKSSLLDPSTSFSSWSANDDLFCSWPGVTCSTFHRTIIGLDLSNKNLSGNIPPEIRLLSPSLTHLNLSGNSFSAPLPSAIFDLRNLHTLDISRNDFNSTLPKSISKLSNLTHLDAYSNSFTGPLPAYDISRLSLLRYLNLGGSYFTGGFPVEICGLIGLKYLHLAGNLLSGRLPVQIGNLTAMQHLEIGYNSYYGGLPAEIGRLRELRYLDVSSANLTGKIPSEIGNLTALESLFLFKNGISGEIPESLSNLKSLKVMDLSNDRISGSIPNGFSNLTNLTLISLMNNKITGEIPIGIGDLPNLQALMLWNNSITGNLPANLGSNGKLEKLDVSSNNLTGPIPKNLCKGNRLARLILFSNRFDSNLPVGLTNCSSLWRVRIESNRISGEIPAGFGILPNLTFFDLSDNNFSGDLSPDLTESPRLQFLNISKNPFNAKLPDSIWRSPSLQIFSASSCNLTGKIPDFEGGCKNLYKLEISENKLNGSIPRDIEHCENLLTLKMDRNRISGEIPVEIARIPSITDVDLSFNRLAGKIPVEFGNCSTLENFNVSFNKLFGRIDLKNVINPSSFVGNKGLCGAQVRVGCAADVEEGPRRKGYGTVVWIGVMVVGVGVLVGVVGMRWRARSRDEEAGPTEWRLTAFQRLNFWAEDVVESVERGDWVVGMGSTGMVYRAEMRGGEIIAVKKLWGKQKDCKLQKIAGVLSEVEILGSVRHRNIVRLLGYCTNRKITMLLYEYMPNGSLDDLLHRKCVEGKGDGSGKIGDWATRYRIATGLAEGICYLHHDCDPVIVHRDLKPSNILLDGEMEARVADFGVAKLIESSSQGMSVVAGSYGYIAPEYAYTLQVDEKSDVYSFGVILLEIVSGRRAIAAEFGDGNSIVEWVREKLLKGEKGGAKEVLDPKIESAAGCKEVREEMMLVLRIALLCTSRNPTNRPSMRDVVSMLRATKSQNKGAYG